MEIKQARSVKIYDNGMGFSRIVDGAHAYDGDANEVVMLVEVHSAIHTDSPQGNYVLATCVSTDISPANMSDADFDALPRVRS
jgi:hypothetical protein